LQRTALRWAQSIARKRLLYGTRVALFGKVITTILGGTVMQQNISCKLILFVLTLTFHHVQAQSSNAAPTLATEQAKAFVTEAQARGWRLSVNAIVHTQHAKTGQLKAKVRTFGGKITEITPYYFVIQENRGLAPFEGDNSACASGFESIHRVYFANVKVIKRQNQAIRVLRDIGEYATFFTIGVAAMPVIIPMMLLGYAD
jgi:hypothetical protein